MHLQYAAPITGVVLLITIQSMRYVRLWCWCGLQIGELMVGVSLLLCLVSFAGFCKEVARQSIADQQDWSSRRAAIQASLKRDKKLSLVIVRYGREHSLQHEWVFNDANLDDSQVVWARDMGAGQNRDLVDFFRDRRIWLLNVTDGTEELVPYAAGTGEIGGGTPVPEWSGSQYEVMFLK
jgi:hypothetical protein